MVAKIKLRDLKEVSGALTYIIKNVTNAKHSWWIMKNDEKVLSELKRIEKISSELVREKYGVEVKDEDGKLTGKMKVPDEKIDAYKKEVEDLLDLETEIGIGSHKIPFEHIEHVPLNAFDIMTVTQFIEEPKDDDGKGKADKGIGQKLKKKAEKE